MWYFLDVFIVQPKPSLSPINSTSTFTCTATAGLVQSLFWEVDGGQTTSKSYTVALRMKGIQLNSTNDTEQGWITQSLTATTSVINNGTQISCVAVTFEYTHFKTPLVTLTVYGRLT